MRPLEKVEVNTSSSILGFENSIIDSRHAAVHKLCDLLLGIACHSSLRAVSNWARFQGRGVLWEIRPLSMLNWVEVWTP